MNNKELQIRFSEACDYLFTKSAWNVSPEVKQEAGNQYNQALFALTAAGLNHNNCYLLQRER